MHRVQYRASHVGGAVALGDARFVEAVRSPDVVEKLATQGAEPAGTSPREFTDFLRNERSKWLTLIKEANLVID